MNIDNFIGLFYNFIGRGKCSKNFGPVWRRVPENDAEKPVYSLAEGLQEFSPTMGALKFTSSFLENLILCKPIETSGKTGPEGIEIGGLQNGRVTKITLK